MPKNKFKVGFGEGVRGGLKDKKLRILKLEIFYENLFNSDIKRLYVLIALIYDGQV